ncbi:MULTISPECIES: alpha/beta hydrolase [Marinobacter]|uniref:Esterase n=1 Tax=Marinobacter profundi TaxID=2666256 RepID=A0A2G1URH1_9GAMM|nr:MULTISPECIES: alpha/beta hydrolase [Marinobacter]MBD3656671.1 alpha/beta hydrolase [Marinobacter sp.]PHQ17104.1 esterase [Marinobacter profundi]
MTTSKESAFLRELYQDWTNRMTANPDLSIDNLRSMFDEWGKPALEPENVGYKSGHIGGVEAIWALPEGADTSRVIIYTHGGGFAVGSADSHRKMAGHLAKALKVTAVILHYRRAPEHPFPAQIDDAVSAYQALLEQGYEANKMITVGDSAGGNLAIASVLKFRDLGLPLPGAVIAYSPWLDMALRGATLESNAATDALVGRPILEGMAGMFLGEQTNPLDPLANPLENDFTGFPPLYIAAGGAETLLSDSQTLYAKATEQGVAAVLSVVPGMQHVFPALSGRAPEANEELARIANWYQSL